MQSYNTTSLLESYVPGTRHWLFDEVNKWLEAAMQGAGPEAAVRSRMFLLLAGPGMVRRNLVRVWGSQLSSRRIVFSSLYQGHDFCANA